jgi:hypothetical protein
MPPSWPTSGTPRASTLTWTPLSKSPIWGRFTSPHPSQPTNNKQVTKESCGGRTTRFPATRSPRESRGECCWCAPNSINRP